MAKHLIRHTECLTTLANEYGVDAWSIWDSSDNQELVEQRQHPGCLQPGDELEIPTDTAGQSLTLNAHNVVVVSDSEYRLPIKVLDARNQPLSGIKVQCVWITSDNLVERLEASTNGNGIARFRLPMDCTRGMLAYEHESRLRLNVFDVGALLPGETTAGLGQRLGNLWGRPLAVSADRGECDPEALITAYADEIDEDENTVYKDLTGVTK